MPSSSVGQPAAGLPPFSKPRSMTPISKHWRLRTEFAPAELSAPPQRLVRAPVQFVGCGAIQSSGTRSPSPRCTFGAGRRGPWPCGHDEPAGGHVVPPGTAGRRLSPRERSTATCPRSGSGLRSCRRRSRRHHGRTYRSDPSYQQTPNELGTPSHRSGLHCGRRQPHSSRRLAPRTPRQHWLRPTRSEHRHPSWTVHRIREGV